MTTPDALFTTVFHEPWWLDAVTGGNWEVASVTSGGVQVARLPYSITRLMGMTAIRMPPLTHTLGPQLQLNAPPGQHPRDPRELINELMSQLPRHDYFNQICDPEMENGLPFYALGYDNSLAYTVRIDTRQNQDKLWMDLRPAMRRAVKKASGRLSIDRHLDIGEFCHFYNRCVKSNFGARWTKGFERRANAVKTSLYEAVIANNSGCLLAARDDKNILRAAIMLVWGHGVMFYHMTAHDADPAAGGSVKLLVWEALKLANQKNVIFDFDGFVRPSVVNFNTGFGGQLCRRIVVGKTSPLLLFARALAARSRFGI